MKPDRRALIFSTVWPEPDSSAAGVRQLQWVRNLREIFDEVVLVSPSKLKEEGEWGACPLPDRVTRMPLPMNDWKAKDLIAGLNPGLVLFDRFILEEQFGAMVYEAVPGALVLLETQDLHLIRRARESLREKWLAVDAAPEGFYRTETALRETASIERVDHSFVVSSFEAGLLMREFSIGADRQTWIPFGFDPPVHTMKLRSFEERADFCWVGNFRHAPNADALRWIRKEIWPQIRIALPEARFQVFGAYPSAEFMDWNRNSASGIRVHGAARDLDEVFAKARVNLAPLRFGAGVKGKILEGFRYGLPVVTTSVGAEGLL
ncbi:MAG: glycosyltransferase, partial [Proteobacteria bacterium]|nr:glycosyltransferase [Pseudomonadota bacterium]